jgi:flavin reductase (DIM6/NTAB) family NADH-FMN oxidoreductase RutF
MECEVMHWYDVKTDKGDPANTVIIGRVKMIHVVSSFFFPPLNPWMRCFKERANKSRKILSYRTRMPSS